MYEDLASQLTSVYRYALRLAAGDPHLAEDITQETLLKAIGSWKTLNDKSRCKVWLFRIASNVRNDDLRSRNRRRMLEKNRDAARSEIAIETGVHRAAVLQETVEDCLAALDRLPERQRMVLYFTACEQLSLHEIANILDISIPAAKASLSVARIKMRQLMKVDGELS